MSLYTLLFPSQNRAFPHMRWVKILLRTLHLTGIAGMCGMFFSTPFNYDYYPFAILGYTTGLLFIAIELWSNGVWLIQLRAIVIYLKLLMLSSLFLIPGHEVLILILLIILSGIISHAPADIRYYSIFHGKKMSFLS